MMAGGGGFKAAPHYGSLSSAAAPVTAQRTAYACRCRPRRLPTTKSRKALAGRLDPRRVRYSCALPGNIKKGKTTLARTIFPDFEYVNLEDTEPRRFARNDPPPVYFCSTRREQSSPHAAACKELTLPESRSSCH